MNMVKVIPAIHQHVNTVNVNIMLTDVSIY